MSLIRSLPLGLLFCLGCLLHAQEAPGPFESLSFEDALRKAGAEHKLVLIDFFTTWCGPCKMLDKQTWSDPQVQAVLREKTVALKIDAEKEPKLAERFNIDAFPSTVLINPDGTLKDKYVGFLGPSAFLEHFQGTMDGKTSLDLAAEAVEKARKLSEQAQVEARYLRGQEYARAGRRAEALEDLLWCYDEGMIRVANYGGVRNSYLLEHIARLAREYPAAKDALIRRRDEAGKRLYFGPEETRAASDFSSLNETLGRKEENLAAFRKLPKGDPRRQRLHVYEELLSASEYEDALEAEPASSFQRMLSFAETEARGEGFAKDMPEIQAYGLKQARQMILARIPALIATQRREEAEELKARLLKLDNSESTRLALEKACQPPR